jgi:hypothetical protein
MCGWPRAKRARNVVMELRRPAAGAGNPVANAPPYLVENSTSTNRMDANMAQLERPGIIWKSGNSHAFGNHH